MKKAIICTFALSLFALPMSLQANPPADAEKTAKPLSAMKATMTSPSETAEAATKDGAKAAEKAVEEKTDAAKKSAEDAGKDAAKKTAGH